MSGIKINTGGGGIAIGDGAVALGVGSAINYGHGAGRQLSKADLAAVLADLGALKGALVGAAADATTWATRIAELEQSLLSSNGRVASAPARRLLGQIGDAAGKDRAVADALSKVGDRLGKPAEPADVFISYKREDRERVEPLVAALRRLHVKVWIDDALAPGGSFSDDIAEQIDRCAAQIVCWSKGAAESDWVRGEAELGRSKGALIAVLLEPCRISPPFNMLHAEDLSGWRGEAEHFGWAKVLQALGEKLKRPGLAALAAALQRDAAALSAWRRAHPDDPYQSGGAP